jgi:hypothetical protein
MFRRYQPFEEPLRKSAIPASTRYKVFEPFSHYTDIPAPPLHYAEKVPLRRRAVE